MDKMEDNCNNYNYENISDVAIIGAGPVGLFAIFQAGMLKMKCHVIDSLESIGGQCTALYPEKPIYDIPAYTSISASSLINKLSEQANVFNPVYHLNQSVEKIEIIDYGFLLTTNIGTKIKVKSVVIAAGCGAFGPNKPPLENIERYEGKSVFYSVTNKNNFKDKNIVIAGGGDSAVDWAILLHDIAKSVKIIHRRNKFRCAPESFDKLNNLIKEGKLEIISPYQLHILHGTEDIISDISVIDLNGNIKNLKADILLAFFGLSMNIGSIANWGITMEKKHIIVNQSNMQTNIKGIFAIGDICTYPGKLKLILSGFSEAAMAMHEVYNIVYPNEMLHFEYSTTKGIQNDSTNN